MHNNTIRRSCTGLALAGAAAGAVLAGSVSSASAAPATSHHVKRTVTQCSHGNFSTDFSLPAQGGLTSYVVFPGHCQSLDAVPDSKKARVKEILPNGRTRFLRSVDIGKRVYIVVGGSAAHPTVHTYHFS